MKVLVELPLGRAEVELEREGLELEARGGFDARWSREEGEATSLEAFRLLAREHLEKVYRQQHGRKPPRIPLNLASHQLADDLVAWSKLNAKER
jgi:hypothetical protein